MLKKALHFIKIVYGTVKSNMIASMKPVVRYSLVSWVFLYLIGCNNSDLGPPNVSITSPANGSPVTGTTIVSVSATDDTGVSRVRVYAREQGSSNKGVLLGSSTASPYTISWYTGNVPNAASVEIYAEAQDSAGNTSASDPVQVKPSNPGLPILSYVAAFTLPPYTASAQHQNAPILEGAVLPDNTPTQNVHSPLFKDSLLQDAVVKTTEIQTQVTTQQYAVEWGWNAYTGALGYGVYLSNQDAVGAYSLQVRQAASTLGTQKYSKSLTDVTKDTVLHGVVTAFTNNGESGLSNTDKTTFLLNQPTIATPQDGESISSGKPTLTWNALVGADGYLYYLYDRNPWDKDAKLIWGNYPQSISSLGVSYPSDKTLPSGTYYWWVAAVKFDSNGQADAFSFSNPRKLVVP